LCPSLSESAGAKSSAGAHLAFTFLHRNPIWPAKLPAIEKPCRKLYPAILIQCEGYCVVEAVEEEIRKTLQDYASHIQQREAPNM